MATLNTVHNIDKWQRLNAKHDGHGNTYEVISSVRKFRIAGKWTFSVVM